MKKSTLFFAALAFSSISFAQVVPNPGFENWVNNNESSHTYLVPQNWITIDAAQTFLYNLFGDSMYVSNSVTRISSAHNGSYAVQMAVVLSNEGDTVAGAILSCPNVFSLFDGTTAAGFPFTQRPANLTGYCKFTRIGGDTATVGIILTKWNTSTGSRDTVADIENYYFTSTIYNYTPFTMPITYLRNEYPDTALIVAGITNDHPHTGSIFTLDDMGFSGNVAIGINEQHAPLAAVKVMPNPFDEEALLSVEGAPLKDAVLEMYDVAGNKVREVTGLSGNDFTISREGLSAGLYFYQLLQDNTMLANGKISVR